MTNETLALSPQGEELMHHFEQGPSGGFAATTYIDSTGNPTIGWGHLIKPGEVFNEPITRCEADAIFRKDCADAVRHANRLLDSWGIKANQQQFDALVSLIFNVGPGRRDGIKGDVADSTLLERWARRDVMGAADQFLVWNKGRVNGKLVALGGLTRRRQCERHLFLHGVLKFYF